MIACTHRGFHSGSSAYNRESEVLRFLMVCDDCGLEVREVERQQYRPVPAYPPPPEARALGRLAIEIFEP